MRIGSFSFSPGLVPTLATLALLPLLVMLGAWQLDRAAEKKRMLALYEQRESRPPLSLDAERWKLIHSASDYVELAYLKFESEGRFDGEHQFLLDNRTRNGVAGFEVLTAFTPSGAGGGLMVNRGWIPLGSNRSALPDLPVPDEILRVTGRIDFERQPLPLLGESGYEQRGWPKIVQRIDLQKMTDSVAYPLLPVIVLLDQDAPAGFTRDWKPYYGISVSRHQGYAVQWFALAIALAVIFVVVNCKRVRNE